MVCSQILDLMGLPVDDIGQVLDLLIDDFLVIGIDQRREEDGRDGNEGKTPKRQDLDEQERDQRGSESLIR